MKRLGVAGLVVTILVGLVPQPAAAEPATGVAVTCTATAAGAIVCIPAAVLLHELAQLGNGKKAFGANGEGMKMINVPVQNVLAASRESDALAKAVRAISGISAKDIEEHGIFGGPNSFFRKPLGLN